MSDYQSHWGLVDPPFLLSEKGQLYLAASRQMLLCRFADYLSDPAPIATLSAPRQSGLSCMLDYLSNMRGFGNHAVQMILSDADGVSSETVLKSLLASLDLSTDQGFQQALVSISEEVSANKQIGLRTVWVLDRPALSMVSTVAHVSSFCDGLSVLVAGDFKNQSQWQSIDEDSSVASGSALRLGEISCVEAFEFLQISIREVGGADDIFSASAVRRIHQYAGGRLGLMIDLAEQSLRCAADSRQLRVTEDHVNSIFTRPLRHAG